MTGSGQTVRTTCPYCGVGCGVLAGAASDGSVTIAGDPDHPANFGRLCSKGSALGETLDLNGRLLHPHIGDREAGWEEALDLVARKFSDAIAEHGPDSVAFYVSGQCLTEDYYVANKLMKGFIGSSNIDTNSRLCMASSVAGHRRAFGSDTVPGLYEDFELADLIVLVGSNLAWCHPVLYQRIAAAKEARPTLRVVLIDPRRTMTDSLADLHLSIRPDGDVALFNGLLAHLAENDRLDLSYIRSHTNGFDSALQTAMALDEEDLERATGLARPDIDAFFSLFARNDKTVTAYSQGVNQSVAGTDKVNAIINCHLATGRIGKPGMGPFSLTGQPNAMGGREVGGLANMLAAHMEIDRPDHRNRVRQFWQSPTISARAGLKAVELFDAMGRGKIKAMWIMATNPVDSLPDADRVAQALKACAFVVVSDIVEKTDTSVLAHVRLPSAAWGEKSGTVTNSERRISRLRAFRPLPGEARPDWWQLTEMARRMGFAGHFSYQDPSEIFAEHATLSALENKGTRDFDIGEMAAVTAAEYNGLEPFLWPRPEGGTAGDRRFFADGGFFTPDRRAVFVAVTAPAEDVVDIAYNLTLNTGRIRDHWHTMTRTGRSGRLSAHIAEPFCEIHPEDARRLNLQEAGLVTVTSRYGAILVRALVTSRQQRGSIFVPLHWTDQFSADARVGKLVPPVTDPFSGQPASKKVPVNVEPFKASLFAFAVARNLPDTIDAEYWAKARCEGGWRMELAFDDARMSIRDRVEGCLGLDLDEASVSYCDRAAGYQRFAWFDDDGLKAAIFMANEPVEVSRFWTAQWLAADRNLGGDRNRLVAGRPGGDVPDRGAIVCSCFSVGSNEIASSISAGCKTVEEIGKHLGAGTNCGSCKSEISGMIHARTVIAAE